MRRVAASLTCFVVLVAPAIAAAPAKITRKAVGPVKLGKTHASLKKQGVLGQKVAGCELGGPGQKAARIKGKITGAVNLTRSNPRRVKSIVVTGGATAKKGVGFGDSLEAITDVFPHAKVDRATEDVFGLTLVTIPRKDGGRFQFGVEVETEEVSIIGVPFISFCE